MNVVVAAFAYNELKYLPSMIDYYRKQDCDFVILDNYSTDGTYEWLVDNGITTGRVNTNDAFWLDVLNRQLSKAVATVKPDWVIYCGIDIRYFFKGTIREEIQKAEEQRCSIIKTNVFSAYNTGEKFELPLHEHFFQMKNHKQLEMIGKWSPGFKFGADRVILPRVSKTYFSDGFLINYGMCKPKEEREVTLERRKKAWALGQHRNHGAHYPLGHQVNWIWSKNETFDIRETPYYDLMK